MKDEIAQRNSNAALAAPLAAPMEDASGLDCGTYTFPLAVMGSFDGEFGAFETNWPLELVDEPGSVDPCGHCWIPAAADWGSLDPDQNEKTQSGNRELLEPANVLHRSCNDCLGPGSIGARGLLVTRKFVVQFGI
jgi:hypothetical protein